MIFQEIKRLLSNRIVIVAFIFLLVLVFVLNFLSYYNNVEFEKESFLKENISTISNEIKKNNEKLDLSLYDESQKEAIRKENDFLNKLLDIDGREVNQKYFEDFFKYKEIFFLILLIFSFLLVNYIFFEDFNFALIDLFDTTKLSLKKLFNKKFIVYLIFISSILISSYIVDLFFINPNFEIHNLLTFSKSIFFGGIKEFLLFTYLLYFITIVFISLLLILLFTIFRKINISMVFLLIFIGLEYIMNGFIPINSEFMVFKYINIFNVKNLNIFYYEDINLGFFHSQYLYVHIGMILILIFFLYIFSRLIYYKKKTLHIDFRFKGYNLNSNSLLLHQIFNTFIFSKGILIIVILIIYGIVSVHNFEIIKSDYDYSYDEMRSRYYGYIDDELIENLNILEKEYLKSKDKVNLYNEKILQGYELNKEESEEYEKYVELFSERDMFLKVKGEIEYLYENGINNYFNMDAYEKLFSIRFEYSFILNLLLISISLCFLTNIVVRKEYKNGINNLYYSTFGGRKSLSKINIFILYITAIIVNLIVYSFYFIKIYKYFPEIGKNISTLGILSYKYDLSLFLVYFLLFIGSMIYSISLINLTYFISKRFTSLLSISYMLIIIGILLGIYILFPIFSPIFIMRYMVIDKEIIALIWISILFVINYFLLKDLFNKESL